MIEAKDEPLQPELGDSLGVIPRPTQQNGSDNEQMDVEHEGSNGHENTSRATGNGGETIVTMVGI